MRTGVDSLIHIGQLSDRYGVISTLGFLMAIDGSVNLGKTAGLTPTTRRREGTANLWGTKDHLRGEPC